LLRLEIRQQSEIFVEIKIQGLKIHPTNSSLEPGNKKVQSELSLLAWAFASFVASAVFVVRGVLNVFYLR